MCAPQISNMWCDVKRRRAISFFFNNSFLLSSLRVHKVQIIVNMSYVWYLWKALEQYNMIPIFLILLIKRMITGRKTVKNLVLVISCIVGYKQLTEYYKIKTKIAVHQCFVCLYLWVEGWYLLPEVCLFEQCSTYHFT